MERYRELIQMALFFVLYRATRRNTIQYPTLWRI